jgi:hypothetical protein
LYLEATPVEANSHVRLTGLERVFKLLYLFALRAQVACLEVSVRWRLAFASLTPFAFQSAASPRHGVLLFTTCLRTIGDN